MSSPYVTRDVSRAQFDARNANERYREHVKVCRDWTKWCPTCRALDSDARAADWRLAAARGQVARP